MTDKELFKELLGMFKLEVGQVNTKAGELHLLEQHSKLEVFLYDGSKGDRFVHIRDEHDFIRLLGLAKFIGPSLKPEKNPFFGCKSKEEICINLDLMLAKAGLGA